MLPIYIVSLKQDIERRQTISQTLKDFDLNFSFVDAIYGKELSEDTINSIKNKSSGVLISRKFPLTPGEIGCSLSHLKVYHSILDNNIEWACILEDDVILDERFKNFITNFQSTGLDTDSLYLLGGQSAINEPRIVKSIKNIRIIGQQQFNKTIKSEAAIFGTCCYLISAPLAKKIINSSRTNFILADDWSYLIKNHIIKNIYLSNFVDHPLDLSKSHLQVERDFALSNPHIKKDSFSSRAVRAIKWRLRSLPLKAYRYIERKDSI